MQRIEDFYWPPDAPAINDDLLNPPDDDPASLGGENSGSAEDLLAQRFFTLSEAGRIFGRTARTMRWWADTDRIRTIKIGRSRFVTAAEIERLQVGAEA